MVKNLLAHYQKYENKENIKKLFNFLKIIESTEMDPNNYPVE